MRKNGAWAFHPDILDAANPLLDVRAQSDCTRNRNRFISNREESLIRISIAVSIGFRKFVQASLFCLLLLRASAFEAVTLISPEGEYWSGERILVVVELRTQGSFAGTATFQVPALPGTQVMNVGNPVVGSEQGADGERFVQRHRFSLFSQVDGPLAIPEIPVTFSVNVNNEVEVVREVIPEFVIQMKRPPGIPPGRFVVSSPDYKVSQTWSSQAEAFEVGDVISRTVSQQAANLSGMALPPLPQAAPKGVRVYPPRVDVEDKSARGTLSGSREEEIRYRFEAAGTYLLPSVTLQWWNPKVEKLERRVLEGREIKIKGPLLSAEIKRNWKGWLLGCGLSASLFFGAYSFRFQLWALRPRKQNLPPLNPF